MLLRLGYLAVSNVFTALRLQPMDAALRLKKLLARCPALDAVAACVRSFAAMMTQRRGQHLAAWLEQAEATGLPPLHSLARGIRHDFNAVTAGLTLDWNSGRIEGNVNRI